MVPGIETSGEDAVGASSRPQPPAPSATILVVDDEPLARELLSELLMAQGYRVIPLACGAEVFTRLDEVDLVLLDAMLPDRDGWSICREVKERYDPLLPVIMVTARTTPGDVVHTFEAGADDYIAKPFHAAELMARIESRLRVHRAERKLREANDRLSELAAQNYQLYQQATADTEEKKLLLREIDHRVRNNLSVIMGLVSMERSRRPQRPPAEALATLENRFRSFLLVHDALRHRSYRSVPVRTIVERILQRLRNILAGDGRIRLEVSGSSADLGEQQGFALALILNELITNALQHAFPDGRSGTIAIHLADVAGEVHIEVADDGVGVPSAAAEEVVGSGRSIVAALVRGDLRGELEYRGAERGTRVVLTFPRDGAARAHYASAVERNGRA
jgi:two-component sensor histidine kinase